MKMLNITNDEEARQTIDSVVAYLAEKSNDWISDEDPRAFNYALGIDEIYRLNEGAGAPLARMFAKRLLIASRSNGLGGCLLCAS